MAKPEENKQSANQPTAALIDESLVFNKETIKEYLEDAARALSKGKAQTVQWDGGAAMHLAVAVALADLWNIEGDKRFQGLKKWEADAEANKTKWFGANASQGRQAYETKASKVVADLDDALKDM